MSSPSADRAFARTGMPVASGTPARTHAGPRPLDAVADAGFSAVLAVAAELLDCPSTLLWAAQDGRLQLVARHGPLPGAAERSRLAATAPHNHPLGECADASAAPRLAFDGPRPAR